MNPITENVRYFALKSGKHCWICRMNFVVVIFMPNCIDSFWWVALEYLSKVLFKIEILKYSSCEMHSRTILIEYLVYFIFLVYRKAKMFKFFVSFSFSLTNNKGPI